jgi:hypothetical protein
VGEAGPDRGAIFVTAGTAGILEYNRPRELRIERLDGSTVVYAYFHQWGFPPYEGTLEIDRIELVQ